MEKEMQEVLEKEKSEETKSSGNSWVIELPEDFTTANNLAAGTKILLTFKDEKVEAEILPPLSDKLKKISNKILEKRRAAYEELKRIGD